MHTETETPDELQPDYQRARQTMILLEEGSISAGESVGFLLSGLQEIEGQIEALEAAKKYARACIAHVLAEHYDNQTTELHGHTISYHETTTSTRIDSTALKTAIGKIEEHQPAIAELLRSCYKTSTRAGHLKIERKRTS